MTSLSTNNINSAVADEAAAAAKSHTLPATRSKSDASEKREASEKIQSKSLPRNAFSFGEMISLWKEKTKEAELSKEKPALRSQVANKIMVGY